MPREGQVAWFPVDHVVPLSAGGKTTFGNLALACPRCNLHKGTNLSSIDPETGQIVLLFNPRNDFWEEHFALVGAEIVGQTPTGRATVRLLQMNSQRRIVLRKRLLAAGEM